MTQLAPSKDPSGTYTWVDGGWTWIGLSEDGKFVVERCFLPRWEATMGAFHGSAYADSWKCNQFLTALHQQGHDMMCLNFDLTVRACVCFHLQLLLLKWSHPGLTDEVVTTRPPLWRGKKGSEWVRTLKARRLTKLQRSEGEIRSVVTWEGRDEDRGMGRGSGGKCLPVTSCPLPALVFIPVLHISP